MTPLVPKAAWPVAVPRPSTNTFLRYYIFLKKIPFFALHIGTFVGLFVVSPTYLSLGLCAALYAIRVFALTAGYHRYFSHRSYKTSRWFQFVLAWLGCSAMQRGPIWWAAHHRKHHKHSDQELDPHSPVRRSVWHSHIGWVIDTANEPTDFAEMKDFARYPELRLMNLFHWVPGFSFAALCYWIDGLSGLVWGFLLSTVLVYQVTFMVNSVCHLFGKRRYATSDDSRNNVLVAILTFGEGWHNNHHHYMSSANQGFHWWELDISYSVLRVLSIFGLVWGLRTPPAKKLVPTVK